MHLEIIKRSFCSFITYLLPWEDLSITQSKWPFDHRSKKKAWITAYLSLKFLFSTYCADSNVVFQFFSFWTTRQDILQAFLMYMIIQMFYFCHQTQYLCNLKICSMDQIIIATFKKFSSVKNISSLSYLLIPMTKIKLQWNN